ncbi:hypothetical protein RDV78_08590 [Bacillota bacterium LX-D]|nr:hypothetical protein [Bacillota bacterium LX-D]
MNYFTGIVFTVLSFIALGFMPILVKADYATGLNLFAVLFF